MFLAIYGNAYINIIPMKTWNIYKILVICTFLFSRAWRQGLSWEVQAFAHNAFIPLYAALSDRGGQCRKKSPVIGKPQV